MTKTVFFSDMKLTFPCSRPLCLFNQSHRADESSVINAQKFCQCAWLISSSFTLLRLFSLKKLIQNHFYSSNWNTRPFATILSAELLEVLWTIFNSTLSRDSALQLCSPNLLTQMSAQKTVAFIKTWKNPADREETGYYRGQRRHLLTLYQVQRWGIWGTEGPGICQSVFLVLLLSPTQTTKAPLRQPLLFFLLWTSTQSFLYSAATVQYWENRV